MLTGARSRCRSIAADSPNGQFGARSERARETPLDMARGEVGRPPVTRRLGAAWSPQSHITGNMWVLEPSRASKEEVSLYQAQVGSPPSGRRAGVGARRLEVPAWQAPTSGGGVPPAAGHFGIAELVGLRPHPDTPNAVCRDIFIRLRVDSLRSSGWR